MDEDIVAKVRALARETFPEGSKKSDEQGVMAVEHIRLLGELGLTAGMLPDSVGGGGLPCETIARAMAEVAYVDASTAVAYNMHIVLAQYFATFPFEPLEPVFADVVGSGATICGSVALPSGETDTRKAGFRFAEDGDDYVVNGKMGFASGSDAATFMAMVGTLEGPEEGTLAVAFPRLAQPGVKIMGNWDAIGLRGTASHDILADGLRIPKESAIVMPMDVLQELTAEAPLEMIQRHHIGMCTVMACWQGLCEATLDFLVDFSSTRFGYTKVPFYTKADGFRSEEEWVRSRLGHMAYLLETGKILIQDFARMIDAEPTTLLEFRYAFVRALYHWKMTLDEFITGAMRIGGAHGYVTVSPLGRLIRDLMGCAVMTWRTDDLPRTVAQGLFDEPILVAGLAGT